MRLGSPCAILLTRQRETSVFNSLLGMEVATRCGHVGVGGTNKEEHKRWAPASMKIKYADQSRTLPISYHGRCNVFSQSNVFLVSMLYCALITKKISRRWIWDFSAEHLESPKPGTNKNWFGTSHFVKQLVPKTIVKIGLGSYDWVVLAVRLAYWKLNAQHWISYEYGLCAKEMWSVID